MANIGITCANERWTVTSQIGQGLVNILKDIRVKHHKTSEQKGALRIYQISKPTQNLKMSSSFSW